jgi:rubrerythrin
MDIKSNASYIKGLAEGYEIGDTKEGKIITKMIELIEAMAERIEDLEAETVELRDYIEEVDEDLGLVEDDLYLDGEENSENYDEEFEDDFDNDFEGDDSGFDELVCPSCGEIICVDESLEIADVVCPACGEKLGDIELCSGDCSSCEGCEEE